MKAGLPSNTGRPSLIGLRRLEQVDLNPDRRGRRPQRLVFEMARDLTRNYLRSPDCTAPAHVLFPQLVMVQRYLNQKVRPIPLKQDVDAFLSPWYGWLVERLLEAIHPAAAGGDQGESPRRIAMDAPMHASSDGEDFILLNCERWTEKQREFFDRENRTFGFFKHANRMERHIADFPVN